MVQWLAQYYVGIQWSGKSVFCFFFLVGVAAIECGYGNVQIKYIRLRAVCDMCNVYDRLSGDALPPINDFQILNVFAGISGNRGEIRKFQKQIDVKCILALPL